MKKLANLFLVTLAFFTYAQEAETTEEPLTGPQIYFSEKNHDFGDIEQGDKVEHVFTFENTGNEALILTDVRTTCGCTAPEWPRDAVLPGNSAEIKVVFNSAGKIGVTHKTITIFSNAVNNPERIKIETNILQPNN